MKLFLVLPVLLLASLVEGSAFITGQQYRYHYNGRIASGIPGVQRQWSGLGLDMKVIIQVHTNYWVVKLHEIRVDKVNKHIHSLNHHEFDYKPSPEFSEHLSKPFKVEYGEGLIKKFFVQREEPEWSVNVKKAILTQFQVNLRQLNPLRIQKGNYLVKPDPSSNYFRVMEDGIGGECETVYNIMSVPDVETPYHNSVLNVSKTRNYQNCKHRPVDGYANVALSQCKTCESEKLENKFLNNHATTYYMIRGDRYHYLIEAAYTDAETVHGHSSPAGETIITQLNQSIVLDDVSKATPLINPSSDVVPVYTLTYKFPGRIEFRDLVDLKKAHTLYATYGYNADINLIGTLFETIAQSYNNINLEENSKNNYTTKYAELVMHFATLPYDKINRLYNQYADYEYEKATPEQKAKVNLFMNVLADVGTNPSYMFVKQLIKIGRITPSQATTYFAKLSFAVKEPTEVLFDDLYRLCSLSKVTAHDNVRKACYLAFAGLILRHCVKRERLFLPTSTYGKSCTPEISGKYVGYLHQKLEQSRTATEKLLFLTSLETAGSQKSIKVLEPLIQGRTLEPLHLRQTAAWGLHRMATLYPEEVLAVVSPVLFNKTEDYEMRIVAFNIILLTRPALHQFYDIVKIMRYSENLHVQNYIYTALQYFANSTHPCHAPIAENARLAFEAIKSSNFTAIYSPAYSFRWVNGGYNKQYRVGGYSTVSYIANNVSDVPRSIFVTFEDNYGGISTAPLEFGFRQQGLDKVLDKIFGPESILYRPESVLDGLSRGKRSVDNIKKELKEMEEALDLVPREYESVFGSVYLFRYGHHMSTFTFDESTFKNMFDQNTSPLPGILALLRRGVKYNQQMYTLALEAVLETPSEMGLPIVFHEHLPTQSSLNVEDFKLEVDPSVFAKDRNLKAPKHIKAAGKGRLSTDTALLITMSVLSPFEKLQYGAGYESRSLVTIPYKGSLKYDVEKRKFSSEYEPFHENVYRSTFEPFTFIDSYADLVPVQEEKSYNPIGIHQFKQETEENYGQEYFGVGLQLTNKYYGYYGDNASVASFIHKHDWRTLLYYYWTNPYLRPYQFQVKVTPSKTRPTRKIQDSIEFKYIPESSTYQPVHAEKDPEFEKYANAQKSRTPRTFAVVVSSKAIGSVERKLDAEFVYQWSDDRLYHRFALYAKRSPYIATESSDTSYCVNYLVMAPPTDWKKIVEMKVLDIDTKYTSKLHVGWGSNCKTDKRIDVTRKLDRTEEQLNYIKQVPQYRSHYRSHTYPYYEAFPHPAELGYNPYVDLYYRCMYQVAHGFTLNYDCITYIQRTTEPRKWEAEIKYRNIPEYFSNATMKLLSLHNYKVFSHVDFYFNPSFNRPEGVIKARGNYSAHYPVYDAELKFPQANLHYNRVYDPSYYALATVYPYSVTGGYFQNYYSNYKNLIYSTCTFDKYIQTFTNTSYEAPLTDCYHVIAKDCTENKAFTVMIAKSTTNPKHKNLKVILKESSIELIPYGGAMKVRVEGKPVKPKTTEPYYHYRQVGSARVVDFIIRIVDGMYFIEAPLTGLYIQFDGSNGAVSLSNYYRGKQCGMCGNMNGREDYTQYSGPEQCYYANHTAFTYSYAIKTSQCTVPNWEKSIICDVNPVRTTYPEEVCTPLRNRIIYGEDFEGQVCFSTKPLPECNRKCKPTRTLTKSVDFHCLRSRDDYAQTLIRLREKRVLYELDNKTSDKKADVRYPESCTF